MKSKILSLVLVLTLGVSKAQQDEANRSKEYSAQEKAILPPCGACTTLVNSFNAKYKAGNHDFEELIKQTCSDVTRGESQCRKNLKEWNHHLANWLQQTQQEIDLKEWLCVDQLQVCCPENHFGPGCQACSQLGKNGKLCSGNGKCKGSGTRKGNGACLCDSGFTGHFCEECAHSHYLSYSDADKTLCSPCHHSCLGDCTGAGPKKCLACKNGFVMHAEHGCQDIDECQASSTLCGDHTFCLNLEGSYRCINCDKACKKCHNQGAENCIECADGYMRSGQDRVCIKDESGKVLSINNARYFTYGGLCIATAIIFQKSTIIAGLLGLVVAVYVSFAEYYLQNMDGELQPVF